MRRGAIWARFKAGARSNSATIVRAINALIANYAPKALPSLRVAAKKPVRRVTRLADMRDIGRTSRLADTLFGPATHA